MATIKQFEDLEVWKQSSQLAQAVFDASQRDLFSRDFALKDQINRSSGSIMDNIAEGFERDGRQEFIQFLSYAKASAGEVRSQLYRAYDRKYLSQDQFDELTSKAKEISKAVTGFIAYLKKSEFRGTKYKVNEPAEI
jgi:four helix bundle protein